MQNFIMNSKGRTQIINVLLIIAVIGGLSVLGGLGYLGYQKWLAPGKATETKEAEKKVVPQKTAPKKVVSKEKISEKTIVNEAADWKIYNNKKYKFEFKYPKEWTFKTVQTFQKREEWYTQNNKVDKVMDLSCTKSGIEGESAQKLAERVALYRKVAESITVDGNQGVIAEAYRFHTEAEKPWNYVAIFPAGDNMCQINIYSNPPSIPYDDLELLKKILATLKFLD